MRSPDAAAPRAGVPLAPLTTLGVGGAAEWYVRAETVADIRAAYAWAAGRDMPVFVLGGGSNIVVSDRGVGGLVIHNALGGLTFSEAADEAVAAAGAGVSWDALVSRVVDAGYAGMECLSGIPGLVGGTPIQNVGAYGQEVADTIISVTALDVRSGELVELGAADCEFGYRQSRFKAQDAGRFIVCGVSYRVRRGAPTMAYPDVLAWIERNRIARPEVADVRRGILEIRRSKGMVLDAADTDTRSVGSFFMNPAVPVARAMELNAPSFPAGPGTVKIPAAWLIERAGFAKGYTAGAAGLSTKHPLAIINCGGATSGDIVDLACRIKRAVLDRFGVGLRPEPGFVGFGDDERVRFLRTPADVDAAD